MAVDIDMDGRLVLERDGVKNLVNAGEVTVVKR
jgi:biotin-(acetyl-CoA carboxylase) ligase